MIKSIRVRSKTCNGICYNSVILYHIRYTKKAHNKNHNVLNGNYDVKLNNDLELSISDISEVYKKSIGLKNGSSNKAAIVFYTDQIKYIKRKCLL